MSHLFERFKRDISGVVWIAVGLFLALALGSYHPSDPSFNTIGSGMRAQNYCGYFGSFLADLLLQTFGLAAWMLAVAAATTGIKTIAGQNVKFDRTRLAWSALLVFTVAGLVSLYLPVTRIYEGQIRLGGLIGMLISGGLTKVFNFAGAAVILWSCAIVLVVFFTEKSLRDWLKVPGFIWSQRRSVEPLWARLQNIGGGFIAKLAQVLYPEPATQAAGAAASTATTIFRETSSGPRQFSLSSSPEIPSEINESSNEIQEDLEADAAIDMESEIEPMPAAAPTRRKVKLKARVDRRVENWELPKLNLLEDPPASRIRVDQREIKSKAQLLVDKLNQFGVRGEVVGVKPGPAVTMFEFKPAADVKISRITDLADDLSLALSSESVRIIAPIPGRDVVGIETSNSHREQVYLKDLVADEGFWSEDTKLPIALGRRADGDPRIVDLRKMPHLLVAGTTGSGKSVFIVSALTGLLFRHSPKTLRLILVDPKQVDLTAFSDLPHLVMPPLREAVKAVGALRWAVREMEKRYRSMSKFGARGIESFNEIVSKLSAAEQAEHEAANEPVNDRPVRDSYYFVPQPYIVIVVEEFGDLMAVDKVNVEQAVVRLAQMARACGIHLILATQSPRKDVVTGLIKTNIPGRVSFKVASKMDSRIILDESGAERLLARGDALFLAPGVAKPERDHAPYLTEAEIAEVVRSWKNQAPPDYDPVALRAIEGSGGGYELGAGAELADGFEDDDATKDDRYDEILAYVSTQKEVSASLIQRRFKLGYPRAARMIETFEKEGVVGPANGSKPRQVLIKELK